MLIIISQNVREVSEDWLKHNALPIFQQAEQDDSNNYRTVSLGFALAKIMVWLT